MIDPASTVARPANPAVVRGRLLEKDDESMLLGVPGASYRIRLKVSRPVDAAIGDIIHGRITVRALRMDVISGGGRFLEPVEGRPRRVQGRIVHIDESAGHVVVSAGAPVTCVPIANQRADSFEVDQMVTMNVEAGATFEPDA